MISIYYEWQLMGKAGYCPEDFLRLQREAEESQIPYEELLCYEIQKLKEIRKKRQRYHADHQRT